MDSDHLLPVRERKLLEWMDDLDAGIGNENVYPAKGLDCLLDPGVDLVLLRDIHANSDGHLLVAELLCGCLGALDAQIGDRHAPACFNVAPGDAMTYTARGTSNQSNLAIELHGSTP